MFINNFLNSLQNKKNILMPVFLAAIISNALFTTSCGFKMRSAVSLPPQLHRLYFQAENPYGSLETSLKRKLSASKVVIVNNPRLAPFILNISAVNFGYSSDTTSIGPSTQARIYHLNLSTTFSVIDAKGNVILAPQLITNTQSLTLNANELFDTNTQVEVVKQNMQQVLITKILDRLGSKKVADAIAEYSAKRNEDDTKTVTIQPPNKNA